MDAATAGCSRPCFGRHHILSLVAFDNVTLELGGRAILSSVSFAVEAGEFVGLLGPNGAGKTTLLRAILGLVHPCSGTIDVLGRPAVRGNRAVGYMPQVRGSTDLRWTGWDFVAGAAGGHRWGLPRLDRAARDEVAWALDVVGSHRSGAAAFVGFVRRRATTVASIAGVTRTAFAAAARRTFDQSSTRRISAES